MTARRRVRLAAAILLLVAAAAVHGARADDTILRLAETVTVMITPDELQASMRAEALAPNAAEAQRRVNELMRDALDGARKAAGLTVSTGGYNVWRVAPTPQDRAERWQAGQSINLTGKTA